MADVGDSTAEITDVDIADDLSILNKGDDLVEETPEEVETKTDDLPPAEVEKDEPTELPAALKAKYPDIFKEFPELRKAVFHEKEFLKLFGTVEEAKEASLKAENQDYLLGEVEKGNLKPLLSGLKETDENTFKLFCSKILPAIYAESKDVYFQIVDPLLIRALKSAHDEGVKNSNDNLKFAAQHIAQLLFGDVNVLNITQPAEKQPDPERLKFEEEKKRFLDARFQEAQVTVDTEITKGLVKEIEVGLNVSGYLKKVILKEIQAEIDVKLTQIPEHMSQMKSLWVNAGKIGFPSEQLARITSTYLARAKPLIPSIRSKVKAELMQTKVSTPGEKLPTSGTPATAKKTGPVDAKKIDWSKTTDADLIAGNVTYKK